MECKNIHYQKVITLCNKFQKGLCFSEEQFIEDLKEQMKIADSFTEQKNLSSLPLYKCVSCGNVSLQTGEEKAPCKDCKNDNWELRVFLEVKE